MRKIKLYIATSLNGKIARTDGSVDWLEAMPNPSKSDYGFSDFFAQVETTIQGNASYEQVVSWDIPFPYQGKENFVLSRNPNRENTEHVRFITKDHLAFIRGLKAKSGGDIWLIGGAQINTLLWNAGLIDEILLFIMPTVLTEGIDLLAGLPKEQQLKLIDSYSYPGGAVRLHYEVLPAGL